MSFPRYPEYKDSGVEWLGKVPAHWRASALKYSYTIFGGSTPSSGASELWDGEIVWVTPADLSKLKSFMIFSSLRTITDAGLVSCGTNLLPPGAIILSTRAPIGSLGIAGVELCTNQGCKGLVPQKGQHSRFGAYSLLVMAEELNVRGRGTTFLELSADALGAIELPSPPVAEQEAIVNFLDHETARIDVLVAEQQRLIELLKEKRDALVLSAMAQLQRQPQRLSEIAEICSRPVQQKAGEIYTPIGLFNRDRGLFQKEPRTMDEMGESEFFWVEEGDLILSGQFAWEGAVAMAWHEEQGCVVSHRYPIIRGRKGMAKTEFLYSLLTTKHGDFLLNENSRGAAGRNRPLNIASLLKEKIVVPPLQEQEIICHLVRQQKAIRQEMVLLKSRLQERRSALISAAVTGKIDVRGWRPPPGSMSPAETTAVEPA